jgi:hypothetical protein
MPALTVTDLNNAKTDVDHIADLANSPAPTATDRLGRTKNTWAGIQADVQAQLDARIAAVTQAKTDAQAAASAAGTSATAAAGSVNQALSASVTSGVYPNTAQANLPRGVPQVGVGAITAGASGTNGSYTNGTVTGSNFTILPKFNYTVAGGALTSVTITDPGLYIGAAPTVGTPSFAGSNLVGANVALTAQVLFAVNAGYWTVSTDGLTLVRFKNVGGVPVDDSANIPPVPLYPSVADLRARAVPGSLYAHQDGNGNAAMMVDNTGHSFNTATVETFNGLKRGEMARRLRRSNLFFSASIVHHFSYGQSLSLGQAGSIASLPTVDGGFFDSVRFNANGTVWAGPRAQEGSGTADQNHASLVPYQEAPLTGTTPSGNAETPLGNALRMVKRLLRDEDGILPTDFDYILLGSAPGLSNTSITGLSKTTAPYVALTGDVTYGLARAQALGKTYAVDVVHWCQGERDILDGMTRPTYLTKLLQLYTDLNTDIKAITGQAHDIKLITYQVTYSGGTPQIALAQLDAAKTNPNIVISTATYAVEHFDPTQVHLAGIGYAHIGAYHGLAAKRTVIEGGVWPAMYPRRLFRQGTILEAEWPDTGYKLAFSTTFFDQIANQGFSVVGVDGVTDNPIVSVSLVAPRRVRVVLTNALPGKLRYGFISWGGNLHDTCDLDPGLPREVPLYQPCLTFEESFA